MGERLIISAGQHTQAGRKARNEDCCGIRMPKGMDLTHKGVVAVIADGVGSSEAGREASEYCVQGFIADYYSTPMSWSVRTSGERIIRALNAWLYTQGQRRYASQLSLASTLSALVLKSTTAHLFHVGDSRIHLLRDGQLRVLTRDHRMHLERGRSYLTRAIGGEYGVCIDYDQVALELGDLFVLTSDGVHEYLEREALLRLALAKDMSLEQRAEAIARQALAAGSDDNLSCQLLRIDALPNQDENEYLRRLIALPFPPPLKVGMELDGYRIVKALHASATIQVHLAEDVESGETVVVKTPSVNFEDDPVYIDRFLHEAWVGRRIEHPHVLRVYPLRRKPSALYYVTEFIEGQSLAQWILDHPRPALETVRDITAQIVQALRAFHRHEMVHQDVKPENIMIDRHGCIKLIDFGSTQVAGLKEIHRPLRDVHLDGTAGYMAPELFEGFAGSPKTDIYALGVTVYQMLSGGRFPYGEPEEGRRQRHGDYTPLYRHHPAVPPWMDGAVRKAVALDPERRYGLMSEFLADLSTPNPSLTPRHTPLIERDPVAFWRACAIALLLLHLFLLLR